MKLLNKKLSLGFILMTWFVIAALVYSLGYKMAMDKFNNVVSYTHEKQKMYSTLSEVDYNIRTNYVGNINESELISSLCKGYVLGLSDANCKFFSKQEYKEYSENDKKLVSDINAQKLNDDILYLKCANLGVNSSKTFVENIDAAISEGLERVIVDLRDCCMGNESEAFKILQYMMPAGDIVSLVDKKGAKEVVCKSTSLGVDLQIIVLVNNKTSGVAEIVASALKDKGNVRIVGVKTAGNAVKEKVVNLSDDSVLVLPEAHYVTQKGNVIFKNGIIPDVLSEPVTEIEGASDSQNGIQDKDIQLQDALKLTDF